MKKSIVIGLVGLALVVLVSPGLVGYLAERSVHRQVEWAADENRELEITSEDFERGWFSSAGRHRIGIAPTPAGQELRAALGYGVDGPGPALIIETHLDHGLIPLTSLQGERGSLMPGLGRATSQLSIEAPDGTLTELPGAVHTTIGLGGTVSSHYAVLPGASAHVTWGAADVRIDSNARRGRLESRAKLEALEVRSAGGVFSAGGVELVTDTVRTPYGYHVGDVDLSVATLLRDDGVQALRAGPLRLHGSSELDDEAIDSHFEADLQFDPPEAGPVTWTLRGAMTGLDALAVGRIVKGLEDVRDGADAERVFAAIGDDLARLLAHGLAVDVGQFDVALPEGTVAAKLDVAVAASDPEEFVWTSLLLSTKASATITLPKALFERIAGDYPEARMAVAGGYLVTRGDNYEVEAKFAQGLLTINGAPMPIPIPSM